MRRGLIVTMICLVTLICWTTSSAEIRAITDRDGTYVLTRVLAGVGQNVWTPTGRGNPALVLNPEGAGRGDLWPTISAPKVGGHPWVVWSRHDGSEFNIAWSRWTRWGWLNVSWLEGQPDGNGDDLDADIDFDPAGRPFVTWWRDADGVGQVLMSVWLNGRWMPFFTVSDAGIDSRFPELRVESESTLYVTYVTPDGVRERTILFEDPVTITDDINPLDHLFIGGTVHVEEEP